MSQAPAETPDAGPARRTVEAVGQAAYERVDAMTDIARFVGGTVYLFFDTMRFLVRAPFERDVNFGWQNLWFQMVRVGIKAISIVVLVEMFIGIILALQMAPTLESYGQVERVADIVGIAMFRELGPLLAGIVLSGFAGASIAAELGTMVEGEEIKALRACALNPIRYLVLPRFIATGTMLVLLTVIADVVGVFGGFLTGTLILGIEPEAYLAASRVAVTQKDFITGLVKAGVFGVMISMIASYEGLNVSGGAEGVGRATTGTVVKCIVALILADVLFTAAFFAFGL